MKSICHSLCFLFAVLAYADATSAESKGNVPSAIKELSWPKVADSHALVEFARNEIEKHKGDVADGRSLDSLSAPGLGKLKLRDIIVYPGTMVLMLDTHPYTGQILLVSPDTTKQSKREQRGWEDAQETNDPRIRYGLLRFFGGFYTNIPRLGEVSVRWRDAKNLDAEKRSWPVFIKMRLPDYPADMIAAGINGSAKIEFVVSAVGKASEIKIVASHAEFEVASRDAIEAWSFEPGVDEITRKPSATRISITVEFSCVDD